MNNVRQKTVLHPFYFTGILLIVFSVLILAIYFLQQPLSVVEIRKNHSLIFNILYDCLIFVPLIFLFQSEEFKKASSFFYKLLLLALGGFLLTTIYTERWAINVGTVFFAATILWMIKYRKFNKPSIVFYFFIAYFLVHLISLQWTIDFSSAKHQLQMYIPFVSFTVAFCCFRLSREQINRLLVVFFRGSFIFLLMGLLCWIYQSHLLHVPLVEWMTFSKKIFNNEAVYFTIYAFQESNHPSFLSFEYIVAFSVGIYLWKQKRLISSFDLIVFFVASFLLTLLTQSRIGLIMLIVVSIIGTFYLLKEQKKYWISFLIIFLLSGTLFGVFFHQKVADFVADPIREQLYLTALTYIKTNPIYGTGVGGMGKIMTSQDLAHSLGYPFAYEHIHPHNQFLGDLMQTGVLGEIVLCGMFLSLIYVSIKQRNFLLFILIITTFLFMLIDMPLFRLKGITFFVLFCCLFIRQKERTN